MTSKILHCLKKFWNFYCLNTKENNCQKAFPFYENYFTTYSTNVIRWRRLKIYWSYTHENQWKKFCYRKFYVVVIHLRPVYTNTYDHSLFLLQKGAYTLTLFFTTNITRLEFRILMITLIQFYKSRMRSNIQKKIKQITLADKPKMYLYSCILVFSKEKIVVL